MTAEHIYLFVGTVHPLHAGLQILTDAEFTFNHPEAGISGRYKFCVLNGTATLQFWSKSKLEDWATARNLLQDSAGILLDIYALDKVMNYQLDLQQITDLESFRSLAFGVDRPGLSKTPSDPLEIDALACFGVAGASPLCRRALTDFRRAITDPAESGFLCYRALESLIQQYKIDLSIEDKKKALIALSNDVNLSSASSDFLWKSAGNIRHGKVEFVTGAAATKALQVTRAILMRYLQRCLNETMTWQDPI